MFYVISRKEAKRLEKEGFNVAAGQIVDCEKMPAWIQRRAESVCKGIDADAAAKLTEEHRKAIEWAQTVRKNVAKMQ